MNQYGRNFRLSIYGESHGQSIGIIIDGIPAGIKIQESDFELDISRRKAGRAGTTTRIESDKPHIISGVYNEYTTGAPVHISFDNTNVNSKDYNKLKDIPRPGHADYTLAVKHQHYNDPRGGGHSSGRMTLALVAAGVIAKTIIKPITISSSILEIGGQANYEAILNDAVEHGDSLGGIIQCNALQLPIGLGEPFFDSIESAISHLAFSIPAIKGIEFGSGFQAARMKGSEHNDPIIDHRGTTATNHAGGINGGISNGNELVFRVAVKPTSSISLKQQTWDIKQEKLSELLIEGRHDACIALRVPVVLEAITAIALAELTLISKNIV